MSYGRACQQWTTFSRVWYILNVDRQPAGGAADLVSKYLQGRHKPIYHPRSDIGDHIVVINAGKVAFSGNKWEEKLFRSRTGRRKGKTAMPAYAVHQLDPTWIMKRMIYRQLPNNYYRRSLFTRAHVFADENVPDNIMENVSCVLKPPRMVPKGINDYTQEEILDFPKILKRHKLALKQ